MTFTGDGCEKMSCLRTGSTDGSTPEFCNNHGACLSLKDMAIYALNSQGESYNFEYTTPWDAEMVHGCSCFRLESIDNQVKNLVYNHIYLYLYDVNVILMYVYLSIFGRSMLLDTSHPKM